jgi:hypothetical protein
VLSKPLLLELAGSTTGTWCGRKTGDSGSKTGRGGVDERGGACLYCALNEETRIVAAASVSRAAEVFSEVRVGGRGGRSRGGSATGQRLRCWRRRLSRKTCMGTAGERVRGCVPWIDLASSVEGPSSRLAGSFTAVGARSCGSAVVRGHGRRAGCSTIDTEWEGQRQGACGDASCVSLLGLRKHPASSFRL